MFLCPLVLNFTCNLHKRGCCMRLPLSWPNQKSAVTFKINVFNLSHMARYPLLLGLDNNSILYVCHISLSILYPFVSMSIQWTWSRFHTLALVANAAVKMGMQISLWDPGFDSFGYRPRSEMAPLCQVKQASHRRTQVARFHFHEVSEIVKLNSSW